MDGDETEGQSICLGRARPWLEAVERVKARLCNTSQQGFFAGLLPSEAQCGSHCAVRCSSAQSHRPRPSRSSQELRGLSRSLHRDGLKPQPGVLALLSHETQPETLAAVTSLPTALCPVRTDAEAVTLPTVPDWPHTESGIWRDVHLAGRTWRPLFSNLKHWLQSPWTNTRNAMTLVA